MMQIREIRQIRQRVLRAAALLGVLVATGAGMAAAPVTASASSMTPVSAAAPVAPDVVLPLTPTDPLKEGPGVDEAAHKCAIIGDKMFPNPPGSTNKVDAVHCADVFIVTIGGSTGNEVIVQNEVFCQWATGPRDGQTFPCSGVSEQVGAGSPQGTAALPAQLCGKIFGKTHSPCTSGRTQHAGFAFSYQPEPVLSAPAKCTFWGESLRVSAILPIKSPNHPLVNAVPLATNSRSVSSSTNARGYCLDV
jgi:hypothetical protein